MDDHLLHRRLTMILVTTRAAVASLQPNAAQADAAVHRGLKLLDGVAEEAGRDGDFRAVEQVRQARAELESLIDPNA